MLSALIRQSLTNLSPIIHWSLANCSSITHQSFTNHPFNDSPMTHNHSPIIRQSSIQSFIHTPKISITTNHCQCQQSTVTITNHDNRGDSLIANPIAVFRVSWSITDALQINVFRHINIRISVIDFCVECEWMMGSMFVCHVVYWTWTSVLICVTF